MGKPLSDREVSEIRRLRVEERLPFGEISKRLNVSEAVISNVVNATHRYDFLEPLPRIKLKEKVFVMNDDKKVVEEKSAFENIGKVDLEEGESEEEITELNREREQFNRIKGIEERLGLVERAILLSGKNQKTLGMATEALVKLNERVVNLEKILLKAVG